MGSCSNYTGDIRRMIQDHDDEQSLSDESGEEYILNKSEYKYLPDESFAHESGASGNQREVKSLIKTQILDKSLTMNLGSDYEDVKEHIYDEQPPLWLEHILPIGRETFTGSSGVQDIQSITDRTGGISVINIFEYFISNDIIDLMVRKTNNYAQLLKNTQTIKHWNAIDRAELKKFFAVILLMSINKKPSIEHYWKTDPLYYNPLFHEISMLYDRFSSILQCWHFEDVQPDNENILYKIQPLVNHMNMKFHALYIPGDTIVINKSQVIHQGPLLITENLAKTSKYGIKIYKLFSANGYIWSYILCDGSTTTVEGLDKSGSVVVKLCEPLLNEGRLIIADNYFTSLELAKHLKDHNTDLCGTLCERKRGLPQEILLKKLNRSEVIARQLDNYVTVLKWRDKCDVLMISTCHDDEMVPSSNLRRDEILKPHIIIDYNDAKNVINDADQFSSYNSPLRKRLPWYKKIAHDLIFQDAIANTRVIYNELNGKSLTILQIKEILIRSWLGEVATKSKSLRPPTKVTTAIISHQLTEIPRNDGKLVRKRCSACYAKIKAAGGIAIRAKQVNKECKICNKAFCLSCFNEIHNFFSVV